MILCVCCYRIWWILIEYSLTVCISQPDVISNIMWMLPSDSAETNWIFTNSMHWSAWHHIWYCVCAAIGFGGYWLNICSLYASVSRTWYQILCGCHHWIQRNPIEYSPTVCIGQPDIVSNIVCIVIGFSGYRTNIHLPYEPVSQISYLILCGCCYWIRQIQIKYSSAVWINQPDILSNIVWMLPSD
jgi:hypothetical protein